MKAEGTAEDVIATNVLRSGCFPRLAGIISVELTTPEASVQLDKHR